ncbi:Solute carrier family 35 member B1 protein [Pyrenophora tritici-repentis]|uniref:UDP-galactose transporter homolog 1 n=2 Tax=Pyrenophora tritici-repentis TaxID=45151 RepID=A0A922SVH5_9PLEO|nr:solute carrier family 35 member B1 protein [Pyrenophora tritici-repentis Pt-1C-BFP]EDU39713.1 solute carrier family 35 member B1 protein [Pyrenophora tritici-repentis Pt-1C-BFP]KAI1520151.1 Solute carrier family 35 member B1 protein [Pyrenophora tritici-repentis]KAI1675467.1 Solute carrier family 35 member B1 protein [Pyrenophora tritici-repentis]KAI1687372.1 Solute carrier family 35 member B1 protein [Pyrenophora tritici-repentis]
MAEPVRRNVNQTNGTTNGNAHHQQDGTMHSIEQKLEEQAELLARNPQEQKEAGLFQLVICVAGIYGSFMTWAWIQERLTTTTHGPTHQRFTYSIFLNTVQSAFAAITGLMYLFLSARKDPVTGTRKVLPIFPSRAILLPLLGIALTSSLASPFGYASLKHIDYVTFILAKSCKLLPVMFLHISLFQKRYPLYKYAVIGFVTLGVAVFTLYSPSTAKKAAKKGVKADASQSIGLVLLGVNLLFDGLTNTVQDHIFTSFKGFTGPQMMCAQNIMSTALTVGYLLVTPLLASTPLSAYLGTASSELSDALNFITQYPTVGWDVLMFSACGAIGQVFIFHTLAHFSSLLLVTVTVTRKMLTMVWSVWWFGHEITGMQWLGVGLVFGGIGAEAAVGRREKAKKAAAKKAAEAEKKR